MASAPITRLPPSAASSTTAGLATGLIGVEAKGAVTHEAAERTFVFRPLYQQADVNATAARDVLTRVFQGSVYGLVAHLLRSERISPEERAQLRELIDAADEQDEKGEDA